MRIRILLGLLLGLLTAPAWAMDFTVTGAVVTATYQEPTVTATNTPLTDLASTSISYDLGAGPVRARDVPATAPTGGGIITTTVDIPVAANQEVDVRFWATATDTSGNESARSAEVVRRIDRLPPGAPN